MQQEVRRSGDIQNTSLLNSWPSCQRSSSAAHGSYARNHVSGGLGPVVSRGSATGGQEIRRHSKHIPPELLALLSTLLEVALLSTLLERSSRGGYSPTTLTK